MGEEKKYCHWREDMDSNYLRAELLHPGEKRVLTIKEVKKETLINPKIKEGTPGREKTKPVLYFEEEGVLPLALNVTNATILEELFKSGNIYDWVGKKIQIFATKTKVAGEITPCIRIDKVAPTTNEVTYQCSKCGKIITKELYTSTIAKYGKPYCSKECYEQDKEVVL